MTGGRTNEADFKMDEWLADLENSDKKRRHIEQPLVDKVVAFLARALVSPTARQLEPNRPGAGRIVLITSGGTTAALEAHTVRFIDNFRCHFSPLLEDTDRRIIFYRINCTEHRKILKRWE
ncbi:unnamed protein product [Protopolystoma xenopodis]|uniref:DNA/pantothenate metabolism flavoprotein C-terminal domain-containing protein n=1 Tax=Protopolystoma xenopodis TaxID=117903 RepID=A0A3S5AZ50_9PLAT|nr:unnamed protein product [Protopolystoma xenopodis]